MQERCVLRPLDWKIDTELLLRCARHNLTNWPRQLEALAHCLPGNKQELIQTVNTAFPRAVWYVIVLHRASGFRRTGVVGFVPTSEPLVAELVLMLSDPQSYFKFTAALWPAILFRAAALGLHRLEFQVAAWQTGLLKSLDGEPTILKEGIQRSAVRANGAWWDLHLFGVLLDA